MFDKILDNFRTTIEAITPDDLGKGYGSEFTFFAGDVNEAPKTAASDRRFTVIPEDGIEVLASISASATMRFRKTVWVLIQYRVGRDLTEFNKRVHKDLDRLVYQLHLPSSWGHGATWALLSRLPGPNFHVDLDDSLTSAVVNIPFQTIYEVTF